MDSVYLYDVQGDGGRSESLEHILAEQFGPSTATPHVSRLNPENDIKPDTHKHLIQTL